MSLNGLVIGVLIFILCLFLAQSLPVVFTTVAAQSLELLKIFFLFLGAASIFIGATSK